MASTADDLKRLAWENKRYQEGIKTFQKLQGPRELLLNLIVIYLEE